MQVSCCILGIKSPWSNWTSTTWWVANSLIAGQQPSKAVGVGAIPASIKTQSLVQWCLKNA